MYVAGCNILPGQAERHGGGDATFAMLGKCSATEPPPPGPGSGYILGSLQLYSISLPVPPKLPFHGPHAAVSWSSGSTCQPRSRQLLPPMSSEQIILLKRGRAEVAPWHMWVGELRSLQS